jgi:hypothetical protein
MCKEKSSFFDKFSPRGEEFGLFSRQRGRGRLSTDDLLSPEPGLDPRPLDDEEKAQGHGHRSIRFAARGFCFFDDWLRIARSSLKMSRGVTDVAVQDIRITKVVWHALTGG